MGLNKKGSVVYSILIALAFFMFGMLFMNFIMDDVTLTRTDLNCASPDTDGDKIVCLIVDGVIPFFIIIILSTAGGYIIGKSRK